MSSINLIPKELADPIRKERGKKSRKDGKAFEVKVRKNLENKGWIISKWGNNVELFTDEHDNQDIHTKEGKLIPAKSQYNPFFKRIVGEGSGFPDFIAFRISGCNCDNQYREIIGVECKTGRGLDKIEKDKCKWLIDNNIFSKILIAKKGEKRGEIIYEEY